MQKYALTGATGEVDIDATVNAAGAAELLVLAHNPVVKVCDGTTPVSVRLGLQPGGHRPRRFKRPSEQAFLTRGDGQGNLR